MRTYLRCASMLAVVLLCAAAAWAGSVDFEDASQYTLDREGNGSATLTTELFRSDSHSILLNVPGQDVANFAKIVIPANIPLANMSGSFWFYIPGADDSSLAPYMYFGVDTNRDGVFDSTLATDSMVIAFITGKATYAPEQWLQSGLDQSTTVHVVGARPGLAAGAFSSSGTQDTLAALGAIETSSGSTWGDLNVLQVRVGAGNWPNAPDFVAYVDDVTFTPEPGTMALLAGGVLALAGLKLRRR